MKKPLAVLFWFLFCGNAVAHDYWLMVDDYFPNLNGEITISACFGHTFPSDAAAAAENVAGIFIFEPDGAVRRLSIVAEGENKTVAPINTRVTKPGTHYVALVRKAGYVSQTTQGYVNKPKDEATGALESSWSEATAIAVVTVGKPSGPMPETVFEKARFRMQIQADPGNLRIGDTIPVRLFLDEKPYRSWLYATYDGFSMERDTFAYATRIPSDDLTGKIMMSSRGSWIVIAKDSIPYPDASKADRFSFACTVTFAVR